MATTSQPVEVYDLLILTDATVSMSGYLQALNESLPQIISVSSLTDAFARIGVLAYRDYCGGKLLEWSGWCRSDSDQRENTNTQDQGAPSDKTVSRSELISFAQSLYPAFGGDWPEAAKTGLAEAYLVMRKDAKTLVLLYTDAPPHMCWNKHQNRTRERENLTNYPLYRGFGHSFIDWVSAARMFNSEKRAQFFPIIQSHLIDTISPFVFLSQETGGSCFEIETPDSTLISILTMDILMAWMGVNKPGAISQLKQNTTQDIAWVKLRQYCDISDIDHIRTEQDKIAERFFLQEDNKQAEKIARENVSYHYVSQINLGSHIKARATPLQDFAKRYVADEAYRKVVAEQLQEIITRDVTAVSVNPIFGSLWRAVCNDRENPERETLLASFGLNIDKLPLGEKRDRMKAWLAESYNFAAEIAEVLDAVPEEERYPCVFLDPTVSFSIDTNGKCNLNFPPGSVRDEQTGQSSAKRMKLTYDTTDVSNTEDGEENKPIISFTREELLELGRSCDYKILRRLGRCLTQLTYATSAGDIPRHIREQSQELVPRIPLELAKDKHKRQFWKILLHLIVPGTKLGARAAALLAALSIRMGIKPLTAAADSEMLSRKDKWNSLDIPETWNTNCLALILDADKSYRERNKYSASGMTSFLAQDDRELFERLVDYSMLRANMTTTLTAKLGWRPEKTKVPIGPLVVCKQCEYLRSVTIMANDGICGLCAVPNEAYEPRKKSDVIHIFASRDITEKSKATWVECSVSTCRAQYVVYDVSALNVRPKCHYCRQQSEQPQAQRSGSTAPTVECTKCLNRMIWPESYRPKNLDPAKFHCTACEAGLRTIVDTETTPKDITSENGTAWLLRNDNDKIGDPLGNRSLFHTISDAGTEGFAHQVEILPLQNSTLANSLVIGGKTIHNVLELTSGLRGWIASRRTQAGVCSLCFSNLRKGDLRAACGRSGCTQKICSGCQLQWYGINSPGRIINMAALHCPFCRRRPAVKALSTRSIAQVASLAGLRDAAEGAGEWVYAWCIECAHAKRFAERVCAEGSAPIEVQRWSCEQCIEQRTLASARGDLRRTTKFCPGCDTLTERTGGCGHMACTAAGCDTHWCWYCGKAVDYDLIYEHIDEVHGSIYSDGDGYESDEGRYDSDRTDL